MLLLNCLQWSSRTKLPYFLMNSFPPLGEIGEPDT